MSLFDKAREAHKDKQEHRRKKLAELNKTRGPVLTAQTVEYMGGYNGHNKATGSLFFYAKVTEFKVPLNARASFTIPNTNIADVAIEGKDEVSRRITVTRLLAVGIFAFALKKKRQDKEAFVTIVLIDGKEVVFRIDKQSPMEVRAKLSQAVAQVRQGAPKPAGTSAPASVADELTKLSKLKEGGVITQEEFDKKKADLLA